MIQDIQKDTEARMKKSVEALHVEFSKLRTGRAHPSLLEHIKIDYYGSLMPLNQIANVSAPDGRSLAVQPWEKPMVAVIEKAIRESDLGLNPSTNGDLIRVPIPALTEDRRKELVKVLRTEAEKARVAVRNIRRDSNDHLKELLKAKEVSEDDEHRAQEVIQKTTDKFIAEIDQALTQRETDVMTV